MSSKRHPDQVYVDTIRYQIMGQAINCLAGTLRIGPNSDPKKIRENLIESAMKNPLSIDSLKFFDKAMENRELPENYREFINIDNDKGEISLKVVN